jgi:hypothetical protein
MRCGADEADRRIEKEEIEKEEIDGGVATSGRPHSVDHENDGRRKQALTMPPPIAILKSTFLGRIAADRGGCNRESARRGTFPKIRNFAAATRARMPGLCQDGGRHPEERNEVLE